MTRRRAITRGTGSTRPAAALLMVLCLAQRAVAAEATVRFDVSAGDLGEVLSGIGAQGRRAIAFPAGLAKGLRAGPIRGDVTVRSAVATALKGTGLVQIGDETGPITVRPARAADDGRPDRAVGAGGTGADRPVEAAPQASQAAGGAGLDLPDIDVVGDRARFGDRGFQPGEAGQTTRLGDAPAREVPVAVTSITADTLRAELVTSPTQALVNASGVTVAPTDIGFNSFTIRGFNTNAPFIDGDPSPGSLFARVPIDGLDRIDVLKGSTSLLSGTSQDGGLVNLVTKAPTDRTIREATVRYGSYGYRTIAFDLGGAVPRSEGLTYRLNMSANDAAKSYAGYRTPHERFIAPVLRWQDRDLDVSVGGRYFDAKAPLPNFTFVPIGANTDETSIVRLPRGIPQGGSSLFLDSRSAAALSDVSARLVHRENFDLSAHNHIQYQTQSTSADLFLWNQGSGDDLYSVLPDREMSKITSVAERADLVGVYAGEHFRQTSKVGYDLLADRRNLVAANGDSVLVNPSNGQPQGSIDAGGDPFPLMLKQTSKVSGVYYLEKFDVLNDRLHIVGNVRSDLFTTTLQNLPSAPSTASQRGLSWLAGAALDVTRAITLYGNTSSGFVPQTAVTNPTGLPAPPQGREGSEIGVRSTLFDKRLSIATSFFSLKQTNVSVLNPNDPTGTTALIVPGEASRGFEIEVQGEILPGLNVIGAFADVHASYQDQNFNSVLQAVPRLTGSIFVSYLFAQGPLAGLTLGFGAHGNSASTTLALPGDIPFDSTGIAFPIPGYLVEDAVIGYTRGEYSIAVKINNIGDRYFYYPAVGSSQIVIGEGRNVLLEVRKTF